MGAFDRCRTHRRILAGLLLLAGCGAVLAADAVRVSLPIPDIDAHTDAAGQAVFVWSADNDSGAIQWLGQTGEPRLPHRVVTLLLPPDADLSGVDVALENTTLERLDGAWDVAPLAPPATFDGNQEIIRWPSDRVLSNGRDVAVYACTTAWPSREAWRLNTGRLDRWQLVQVAVPLVRYQPVAGLLTKLTAGEVVVTYERNATTGLASAQTRASDPRVERHVQRLALNYPSMSVAYDDADNTPSNVSLASSDPGYVIITTEDIIARSSQLSAFVSHKVSQGFSVQVITEIDYGLGSGDWAAENIRTWLQNHDQHGQLTYALLIGDANPNIGQVPMKWTQPTTTEATPTDYYYADLTGDWDLDNDGLYGEFVDDFGPGGVDRYAEVFVGRIPYYGNIVQLGFILAKTIAYENETDTSWRKNVLLPMRPSDELTPGFPLGEAIKDDLLAVKNWPYHRIYDEHFYLNPPPETVPCNEANVRSVWSSNPFGLAVWWAHGSISYASGIMSIGSTTYLNNDYPTFTFQATCGNAYPEDPDNLAYALLKNGGIVTIGASRTSWYIVGQVLFQNHPSNAGMAYEYTSRLVGARTSCGFALHDLRERIYPTTAEFWKNYVAFNIYGDPSLHLLPLEARRYVNAAAPAGGDGTTWATAYNDLQDALADVPAEIWVAAGEYKPARGTTDRTLSFQLINGVELYGGFDGSETTLFQRDPLANPTILCGDLNADDDPNFTNRSDNSYHVVTGRNTDATAVLDGFVIRGGGANYGSNDDGGGLWCEVSGSPTIRRCVFEDNEAKYGGAVRCDGVSHPTFIDCIFRGNQADIYSSGYGGALSLNNQSSPFLYNCVFVGNRAATQGGAVYYRYGTVPTLVNCTFAKNHATNGGGIYGNNSSTDCFVDNCIFWGNTRYVWGAGIVADESGQIMSASSMTINHSCVQAWSGSLTGVGNTGDDPLLIDPNGADGVPGTADDDLRLATGSSAQDTGNNTALPTWLVTDLAGAARIQNGIVDMGAYELAPAVSLPGDCDADGDVDMDDLEAALSCLAGPGVTPTNGCACSDVDADSDVDVADIAVLQQSFTGAL